jgi:hypothetical protein
MMTCRYDTHCSHPSPDGGRNSVATCRQTVGCHHLPDLFLLPTAWQQWLRSRASVHPPTGRKVILITQIVVLVDAACTCSASLTVRVSGGFALSRCYPVAWDCVPVRSGGWSCDYELASTHCAVTTLIPRPLAPASGRRGDALGRESHRSHSLPDDGDPQSTAGCCIRISNAKCQRGSGGVVYNCV